MEKRTEFARIAYQAAAARYSDGDGIGILLTLEFGQNARKKTFQAVEEVSDFSDSLKNAAPFPAGTTRSPLTSLTA